MTAEDASKVAEPIATAPDPDEDDLDDLDGNKQLNAHPSRSGC